MGSFIIKSDETKFIGKADERLRVAKLEIRNKDTDDILISIDRNLAETYALKEVRKYADEWFSSEFPILLSKTSAFSPIMRLIYLIIQQMLIWRWQMPIFFFRFISKI